MQAEWWQWMHCCVYCGFVIWKSMPHVNSIICPGSKMGFILMQLVVGEQIGNLEWNSLNSGWSEACSIARTYCVPGSVQGLTWKRKEKSRLQIDGWDWKGKLVVLKRLLHPQPLRLALNWKRQTVIAAMTLNNFYQFAPYAPYRSSGQFLTFLKSN